MGNPLFNEVLVALQGQGQLQPHAPPTDDAAFATYARNPELAVLINTVFGTNFATHESRRSRGDLHPRRAAREHRRPARCGWPGRPGSAGSGFIGGDTTNGVSGGWPNGRRLGDDVVDIALTAIASGPTLLDDHGGGRQRQRQRPGLPPGLPYSATPHAGPTNRKDP